MNDVHRQGGLDRYLCCMSIHWAGHRCIFVQGSLISIELDVNKDYP